MPAGIRQGSREIQMDQLTVSISETARILGLGRTTIYAMIANGRLEAIKLGRRRLVKAESIQRLLGLGR